MLPWANDGADKDTSTSRGPERITESGVAEAAVLPKLALTANGRAASKLTPVSPFVTRRDAVKFNSAAPASSVGSANWRRELVVAVAKVKEARGATFTLFFQSQSKLLMSMVWLELEEAAQRVASRWLAVPNFAALHPNTLSCSVVPCTMSY